MSISQSQIYKKDISRKIAINLEKIYAIAHPAPTAREKCFVIIVRPK
jgi:hypothetical protein